MTAVSPVALALCAFLSAVPVAAVLADTAPTTQGVEADQEGASMLLKVQQQILAGHTVAPLEDNALATWEEVRKRAQEPSPAFTRAVQTFIRDSEQRAATERSAGRDMVAFDLQAFADMAQELLQHHPGGPAAGDDRSGDTQTAATAAPPLPSATPPSPSATPPSPSAAPAQPSAAPPVEPAANSLPIAAKPAPPVVAAPSAEPSKASLKQPPGDTAPVLAAPATSQPPRLSAAQERMATTLVSRGDTMLAIKDISAARKLYEQAANLGSAAGAAELARTYDPGYISKLNVIGIRPDVAMAANWYVRAAALGDSQAAQRMHELDAMLGASPPARGTP